MKMKQILVLIAVFLPIVLLANGDSGHYEALTGRETDYIPRIFNFTIFIGILYYLLANPIKNFFNGRKEGIANQLKEIEAKLQASKDEQKEAEARVEESKVKAEDIIKTANKEAEILSAKIAENSDKELILIDKQYEDKIILEERKVARETIDEVLYENISNDDIHINGKKVINLISGKVA
ncbi:ATP synthase F0 sector subunit b [hydrothermal vent metagenome]|uniref:ATP synthase F0 sector subunit b n=1 Tax=hydrothermal vent metagenome TaxID=652676 RepID=A0A1W1BMC4_9ZZZZ